MPSSTQPYSPIVISTKLPMEYTLPELGTGEEVKLVMVTSDKGGRLEQVMGKATTVDKGHFVLKGSSPLVPSLNYPYANNTLNVAYYLKLPGNKRIPVKVADPPQFKPLKLDVGPGGKFAMGMAGSYSTLSLMFCFPLVGGGLLGATNSGATEQSRLLSLLAFIVGILLTLRPIIVTYFKRKNPWATITLSVGSDGHGELNYIFLKDKAILDLQLKVTSYAAVNSNFSGSRAGFFIVLYETQLKMQGEYLEGQSLKVSFQLPEDILVFHSYNLSFTLGNRDIFDPNIHLYRAYPF